MIADVKKYLNSARASIADVEANIAEFSAVKADTASDPDNQSTEDAEAAAIRAAKVASAKAELSQAIAHLHGALTADWSADALPVGDAPATTSLITGTTAADAQPSPNAYGGGATYGSGATWGSTIPAAAPPENTTPKPPELPAAQPSAPAAEQPAPEQPAQPAAPQETAPAPTAEAPAPTPNPAAEIAAETAARAAETLAAEQPAPNAAAEGAAHDAAPAAEPPAQ